MLVAALGLLLLALLAPSRAARGFPAPASSGFGVNPALPPALPAPDVHLGDSLSIRHRARRLEVWAPPRRAWMPVTCTHHLVPPLAQPDNTSC